MVSVVIPTFNSERFLEECLRSVKEQTYRSIEVIVVDRNSMDRTKEIARNHGARITVTETNRSKARNIGAQMSRGSFVFFVDSDMELESSVVSECIKKAKEAYDGIIVPEVSVGDGFWAKCKALEKACYVGDDAIEAARFIKRRVFQRIGGYDPELEAGEDWDLSVRISKEGYRTGRIDSFIRHNEGRLGLREAMLKKHYYGKPLERYRKKHPEEAKLQLRLIRPAFTRNWNKLAKDPVHALGMFLIKFCEFGAVELGRQIGDGK